MKLDNQDTLYSQWFKEKFEFDKGRVVTIAIKEHLESYQSKFQQLDMYVTVPYGKMLTLDGVIMLTEYDNFAYHEMIAHVPMMVHPKPRTVLVVGGGDGGTLKELLKHPSIEAAHICEIDEEVIKVSQRHFPDLASSFDDDRVTVHIEDAAKFITKYKGYFDVICVDSSDPIGPAEVLFRKKFYRDMHTALTEDGIVVTQSESMYYHQDLVAKLYQQNQKIYNHASYYYTIIPTYPSGTIGFSFCSKKYTSTENFDSKRMQKLGSLKYYNESIHSACFALPQFMKNLLV